MESNKDPYWKSGFLQGSIFCSLIWNSVPGKKPLWNSVLEKISPDMEKKSGHAFYISATPRTTMGCSRIVTFWVVTKKRTQYLIVTHMYEGPINMLDISMWGVGQCFWKI